MALGLLEIVMDETVLCTDVPKVPCLQYLEHMEAFFSLARKSCLFSTFLFNFGQYQVKRCHGCSDSGLATLASAFLSSLGYHERVLWLARLWFSQQLPGKSWRTTLLT